MIPFSNRASSQQCSTTSCTRPDAKDLQVCETGRGRVLMSVGPREGERALWQTLKTYRIPKVLFSLQQGF